MTVVFMFYCDNLKLEIQSHNIEFFKNLVGAYIKYPYIILNSIDIVDMRLAQRWIIGDNGRAAKINQLIILTYCLKILIFYHTKILRYPKTIIIIL